MKKLFLFFTFLSLTYFSQAQIHEIGITLGGSNYIGDIGKESYIYPNNIAAGIVYKYNANPRIAWRGAFTYAQISANDADAKNSVRKNRGISFTNTIKELSLGLDFNFWEYDLSTVHKTASPYLIFEIAIFNAKRPQKETSPGKYSYQNHYSFAIPFGIGYKTKLIHDFSIALELRGRYTFTDSLDYNHKEIKLLSFGNPNNNDWYMFSTISFIYTFGRPPCYAPR
ncbi:MAG: hypothetical protein COB98_05900 [Flavobacteriaceae bacterium]|nr:MAG: hypothetical protein COB98_05900 [Flavobacteriaceae bacterium]